MAQKSDGTSAQNEPETPAGTLSVPQRAWAFGEDVFEWVWSYPLTNMVLLLWAVSLAMVPQVQQVVFDGIWTLPWYLKVSHGLALGLAIGFHLLALVSAAPMMHPSGEAPFEARLVRLVERVPLLRVVVAAGRWGVNYTRAALGLPLRLGALSRNVAVLVGLLWISAGVSTLYAFYALSTRGMPLEHPWAVQVAFFMILIGVCSTSAVNHGQHRVRPYPLTWQVTGARLFLAASVSTLVAELLWWLGWSDATPTTFRPYTVWVLFLGFYLLASVSRLLELKLMTLPGRVLGAMVLAAVFLLSAAFWDPTRPFAEDDTTAEDLTGRWFDQLEARIAAAPPGPLILVAAAGGGTRAAAYTMMVLESLRRADPLHPELYPDQMLSNRVIAISSVSGGSLGTVHFAANENKAGTYGDGPWLFVDGYSVADAFDEGLAEAQDRQGLSAAQRRNGPKLRHTPLLDDMLRNFMAPTLRGMLLPGLSRGEGISAFWQQAFDWPAPVGDGEHVWPLLLLNTTDVDTGDRVVMGFPSLPPGLLHGHFNTWSISDYSETIRPTLADGVRLSSAVPWGFDMPQMTAHCGGDRPLDICRMRFSDGGVFDNTGMHTLRALTAQLTAAANRHSWGVQSADDDLERRAFEIVDQLRTRGVLLIEIDSGAKEIIPGHSAARVFGVDNAPVGQVYDTFITPWNGMSYAAYSREAQTRDLQLDEVRGTFFGAKATSLGLTEVSFRYDPEDPAFGGDEITEVPTAWALGAQSVGSLAGMFEVKRETLESKIDVALCNLSVAGVDRYLLEEIREGARLRLGRDHRLSSGQMLVVAGSLATEGGECGVRTLYPVELPSGQRRFRLAETLLAYEIKPTYVPGQEGQPLDQIKGRRVGGIAMDALVSRDDLVHGEIMSWAVVTVLDEDAIYKPELAEGDDDAPDQ